MKSLSTEASNPLSNKKNILLKREHRKEITYKITLLHITERKMSFQFFFDFEGGNTDLLVVQSKQIIFLNSFLLVIPGNETGSNVYQKSEQGYGCSSEAVNPPPNHFILAILVTFVDAERKDAHLIANQLFPGFLV